MNLEEGDVILCTVKRIEGTTVFLDIEDHGEGTMIFSEVSPGRIRNIREFVTTNKKVVCKILKIKDNHIQLSLRRVTAKEREEVLERNKKEKVLENILKTVFKDKTQQELNKIKENYDLADFLDELRENPEKLDKLFKKEEAEKLRNILAEKKEAEKEVKKIIILKSLSHYGLKDIKEVLESSEAEITYKGSSQFYISVKAKDFKTANHNLDKELEKIKEKSKSLHVQFETK